MPDFQTQLADLLKARFPLIYVPTWEEERAMAAIQAVASDASRVRVPRKVYTWSVTRGLTADGAPVTLQQADGKQCDLREPWWAMEYVEQCDEAAVFVLRDFHPFFGSDGAAADAQAVRRLRDLVPVFRAAERPRTVILLSPVVVIPPELQKDVTVLEFSLPTADEIRRLLQEMIRANQPGGRIVFDLTAADAEALVGAALGLTLQEAESAYARCMVNDGRLDARDVETVLEEKRQIVRRSGILEFVPAEAGMGDVGGLENLKRWLSKRDRAWSQAARRYSLPPPKGVLVTGVPGCGKSLIAKAMSAGWKLPLLRMDVGRIFGSLIGNSEENMRGAIRTAEALAPCVLWIDEIEKGFGGRGELDGGTSKRVFATFLTWMQEKKAPVFVVATANDIESLPPELLRKGRFDEIFFVDLPTRREREEIFRIHLGRRLVDPSVAGDVKRDEPTLARLAVLTEGFAGAEIEQVVISGLFEAFAEDRAVRMEDFERAVRDTVPLSVTQEEGIRAIRAWAGERAVAATPRDQAPLPRGIPEAVDPRGGRAVDF